jgi:glutamate synthase domain-containing protein 1/glutamate synthase domain-containing protein 3
MTHRYAERILQSRRDLVDTSLSTQRAWRKPDEAAEGGCGVLGFVANIPIAGRHVLSASRQMHNRGNGKGGGIAMVGLDPTQAGVDAETLRSHYLLQIALLDPEARQQVEQEFIFSSFDLAQAYALEHLEDYRQLEGLEVPPPDVWRYFVRVKSHILDRFAEERGLLDLPRRILEDEFVYQNSFRLNQRFYASLGEKRAFVLSHGRDLSVLKVVGYAEDVVQYYNLEDQSAHVWIAHQRYPTKGRVWHPGGAHPFIGLNEALVHNGDFANYHAVSEYLRQRNIGQLFLTDTEVSVQLFDLWDRVYGYPLEITLEAMAPTTEHDFAMLPDEKREIYRAVQRAHLHGSPDGPWFFIVARSHPDEGRYELLGITDTSMLRPQVFALYENDVQIGLIASERQAINACLRSLAEEDERFQPVADRYWVARGGSHTDGGAFRFTYSPGVGLSCANKFGAPVALEPGREHVRQSQVQPQQALPSFRREVEAQALHAFDNGKAPSFWRWLKPAMSSAGWDELAWMLEWMGDFAGNGDEEWHFAADVVTLLRDRRYETGTKKRASVLRMVDNSLVRLFDQAPPFGRSLDVDKRLAAARLTWDSRRDLRPPLPGESMLLLDTLGFPPDGDESAARWLVQAHQIGWRHLVAYNWRGGRFAACGFGPDSQGTRVDLYGDAGDYAGSGLDGAEVHLHGDGQDQLGQILKRGKLVVHGDVGQTFLYGAKGGEIYVLGSAAGRPLINAVGRPRAVINGTCLDYLAESFMAGNPLQDGGFVILNGVAFDEGGRLRDLPSPYPGGNLFSLASGGAIYLRDPHSRVDEDQLNGGAFAELGEADWALIEPYLHENERLFEIAVEDLLTVDGHLRAPQEVYHKVEVHSAGVLRDTGLAAETENR